jgi:hypothetical protein
MIIESITEETNIIPAINYISYFFCESTNQWYFIEVVKNDASLYRFSGVSTPQKVSHDCLAVWLESTRKWSISDNLDTSGLSDKLKSWFQKQLKYSLDETKIQRPRVKTSTNLIMDFDAVKWFQDFFVSHHTIENRILAGKKLLPNQPLNKVYTYDNKGNIEGVKVDRYKLLHFYLKQAIEKESIDVGIREFYLPSTGIFSNKKRKRK